jgi:hypothetical protein
MIGLGCCAQGGFLRRHVYRGTARTSVSLRLRRAADGDKQHGRSSTDRAVQGHRAPIT